MITKRDIKETKRILISQMVLSIIYFLFGLYMLIVKIINKNMMFDQELNISLSLIVIGGIYATYCMLVLTNPKKVEYKTIKAYDPSNKDIKEKTIRNGYYFYFVMSIIFMIIFYIEDSIDGFAITFGLLFFVIVFQILNYIYYKVKYNIQNKEEKIDKDNK